MAIEKPQVVNNKEIARTRLFRVHAIDLEFSNGVKATFEILHGGPAGAVMVIPVLDSRFIVMVREYMAGTDAYELGFPKGRIDDGETVADAAGRELSEEAGYGANRIEAIRKVAVSPAYADFSTTIVIATELYPRSAAGDEPEPLEVVRWPVKNINGLLEHPEISESRTLLGIYLLKEIIAV